MSLPNGLSAQPDARLHNFAKNGRGTGSRKGRREEKKRRTALSLDCVTKVDLLFHLEKPVRQSLASQRHVTEARGSYQPAGTWPAVFALAYASVRTYIRTHVPIGRLALNWTHVTRHDARWLLRLKWKNVCLRNCSTAREKGRAAER